MENGDASALSIDRHNRGTTARPMLHPPKGPEVDIAYTREEDNPRRETYDDMSNDVPKGSAEKPCEVPCCVRNRSEDVDDAIYLGERGFKRTRMRQ